MCNAIFINNQKFKFDIYGLINTPFGFIQKLKKTIRIINITEEDVKIGYDHKKYNLITKKVKPSEKINNIPAKIYGDIIRFKLAGWKIKKIIPCYETSNELPTVRLGLTLYKKKFNLYKYILPFKYIKYKTNITTVSLTNKTFEYILYEEKVIVPQANCCIFDKDTDEKAIYLLMLIMSAQLNERKMWYKFKNSKQIEYVKFKE